VLHELSWRWIAVMAVVPFPVAALIATPVWRRREMILGNIAGTVVIFGIAVALILRESSVLDAARQACFDAGQTTCVAEPSAFARHAVYSSIGMAEVVALFLVSLRIEHRVRERDYAPEWRR
jgi:hypothetical protein